MGTIDGCLGGGLRGKFDGLSIYKMRGVDKVIVRKSAGHSKENIKKDPRLERFRLAGSEFGGRAAAAKYLMQALIFHKGLADYNIAGPLISLMKPVQELDTTSDFGKRNIILSSHAHYLKEFSLNRAHTFDSVIRFPVTGAINREALTATVKFPELIPGINFIPPVDHPYYSLRIALGVVPDIVHKPFRYEPTHIDFPTTCADHVDSEWFPLLQRAAPLELSIQHAFNPPNEHFTLVLTVGIRYGILKGVNVIDQAPYVGSAKILEVG